MIDALVANNYTKYGYEYINIDDCWSLYERSEYGLILPDPHRFPNGISYIVNYAHSKGVKLGLYTDIGDETCEGYPGLAGYMKINVDLFASWGIDSLKVDGCNADPATMNISYP